MPYTQQLTGQQHVGLRRKPHQQVNVAVQRNVLRHTSTGVYAVPWLHLSCQPVDVGVLQSPRALPLSPPCCLCKVLRCPARTGLAVTAAVAAPPVGMACLCGDCQAESFLVMTALIAGRPEVGSVVSRPGTQETNASPGQCWSHRF